MRIIYHIRYILGATQNNELSYYILNGLVSQKILLIRNRREKKKLGRGCLQKTNYEKGRTTRLPKGAVNVNCTLKPLEQYNMDSAWISTLFKKKCWIVFRYLANVFLQSVNLNTGFNTLSIVDCKSETQRKPQRGIIPFTLTQSLRLSGSEQTNWYSVE